MLASLLYPRLNVDVLAIRDPKRFIPKDPKGIILFPEWLENAKVVRWFDDALIDIVQSVYNPVTMTLARIVSDFFSVEVAAALPYLLLFLCWDEAVLHVLSHSVAALTLFQMPKRFVWRFRPYMISRAKMGSSDRTSSFPARTVSLGIVFTYMVAIVYHHYSNQEAFDLAVYYGFLTAGFILITTLTSCCRILLGAHYPSDCVVGVVQGAVSCFVGEGFYSILSCPKDLVLVTETVNWSWSNMEYQYIVWWSGCGLLFIVVSSLKPILLWSKMPILLGLLLPSIVMSRLVCPTLGGEGKTAYTLSPFDIYMQHYIVLTIVLVCALAGYRYFKPRGVPKNALFFMTTYLSLLFLLMLQRLSEDGDVQEREN